MSEYVQRLPAEKQTEWSGVGEREKKGERLQVTLGKQKERKTRDGDMRFPPLVSSWESLHSAKKKKKCNQEWISPQMIYK